MKVCLTFAILVGLSVNVALAGSKNWSLTQDMNGVKVWQYSTDSNITGSLQEISRERPMDSSPSGKEAFYKSFEEKKKRMLGLIGVSDWKASSYKWKDIKGAPELFVEGTYRDSSGVEIAFSELHIFKTGKTIQVLQTVPFSAQDRSKFASEFFEFIRQEVMGP